MTGPKRRRGRPRRCPDEILERVVTLRRQGALLREICDDLNADGTPTPGGGPRWYPSHVSRLLNTIDAQVLAEERAATVDHVDLTVDGEEACAEVEVVPEEELASSK